MKPAPHVSQLASLRQRRQQWRAQALDAFYVMQMPTIGVVVVVTMFLPVLLEWLGIETVWLSLDSFLYWMMKGPFLERMSLHIILAWLVSMPLVLIAAGPFPIRHEIEGHANSNNLEN